MGRKNRSRKRSDEMNRIKKVRYAKRDLERLKKMLGITDDGNVDMKEIAEVAEVKTARQIKQEQRKKEEEEVAKELTEQQEEGENIEIVNEKTGKKHVYNTKTFRDQNGSYPAWFKSKKVNQKRNRKMAHSRKRAFKQYWTTTNVPL